MAALLAIGAAVVFGVGDFFGGLASRRVAPVTIITMTACTGAVLSMPVWLLFGGAWSRNAVVFGAAAGLLGAVGLGLLFTGLATGPFQLVSPVSAVVSGAMPVVFGITTGDRPGTLAVIGLVLTPLAIWIVAGGTTSMPTVERTPLLAALGAGAAFGLFFICLDAAPDDAGFVPVVMAKVSASTVLLGWAVRRRRAGPIPRRAVGMAVVSGASDMTANSLFLAATRVGSLTTVGALVSLYPAMSAVLAAGFLGERIGRLQLAGFVLAVGAGLLLAV